METPFQLPEFTEEECTALQTGFAALSPEGQDAMLKEIMDACVAMVRAVTGGGAVVMAAEIPQQKLGPNANMSMICAKGDAKVGLARACAVGVEESVAELEAEGALEAVVN